MDNEKEKRIKFNQSLYNGESVYVYYWEDDIVVRFQRINKELMCYPKGHGRKPKGFNFKDNTYMQDALALGEPITKEEYEKF
jgi:hypothetical protein